MKKDNKLRKNYDFQRIINSKKSVVSKFLVIYNVPNTLGKTRIGISISKKFTNAVGRNRIRRQVREILDGNFSYDVSKDLVIIVRKPFMSAEFEIKTNELKKLLERI